MKNECFHYYKITDEFKTPYKEIYYGIKEMKDEITCSKVIEGKHLLKLFRYVMMDNPIFFYVNESHISYALKRNETILYPKYYYSKEEVSSMMKRIIKVIDTIKKNTEKYNNDQFKIERYLHNTIAKNVEYDYDALKSSTEKRPSAYNIDGVFLDKKAVCYGIAKAFKLMCNECGIKCAIATGKAVHNEKDEDTDNTGHAWNIVRIEGKSYHVDVTWDRYFHDDKSGVVYDYFNVTTDEMLKTHIFKRKKYPECKSHEHNFYYRTNAIVGTVNELKTHVKRNLKKGRIDFKVRDDFPDKLDVNSVGNIVSEVLSFSLIANASVSSIRISHNDKLNIFRVTLLHSD